MVKADPELLAYNNRKNKLVSKEFAYEVINEMKAHEDINLYQEKNLKNHSKMEDQFVSAYDKVLEKYINEDKLNLLPQIFKQDPLVMNIKNRRMAMKFGYN